MPADTDMSSVALMRMMAIAKVAHAGQKYGNKGDYDRAIEFYNKSLRIRLATLGEDHPHTAMAQNNLNRIYEVMGDTAPQSYNLCCCCW